MTKEFLFSRHGESVVNISRTISNRVTDYAPLTEIGRNQANELAKVMGKRELSTIYTSPLTRAYETAQIVGTELDVKVIIEDGLREPDCGEVEGRSDTAAWRVHAELEEAWRSGNIQYFISGGESYQDVLERFETSMRQIITNHEDDTGSILIVSHGSVMRNMLPHVLKNITHEFTHSNPLQNCSVVVASPPDDGLVCTEWNGTPIKLA